MKTATQKDAEHIWQILVTLVMETRGDWKRKCNPLVFQDQLRVEG
jgi:hypothetical protein